MSVPSTKILDHIVHLTPPGTVEATSQKFRELGFNVVPGGTHADGLTANALVVFQDGVYLELISFTHELSHYPPSSPERSKRESHFWASKANGWIDYAFLGDSTTSISNIINERARLEQSRAEYLPEAKGGRERPDGKVLKWVISGPGESLGRGTVPFFCGDVTPRKWRVPVEPHSNTEHPSTASGIAYARVLTSPDEFATLSRQFTSILGLDPSGGEGTEVRWVLETPATAIPIQKEPESQLILNVAEGEEENEVLKRNGPGVYEVGFWVAKDQDAGSVLTPYGKIVWKPSKA